MLETILGDTLVHDGTGLDPYELSTNPNGERQ